MATLQAELISNTPLNGTLNANTVIDAEPVNMTAERTDGGVKFTVTDVKGTTTAEVKDGAGGGKVDDVRVNGTSVVMDKVADVSVPTKTSDIINDSGFITSVDVPTKVSELTNDSGYVTNAYHDKSKQDSIDDLETIRSNASDAESKAHEHSNKNLLDSYTQTNSDIADAISKAHSHDNKTVLDGISSDDISAWNGKQDAISDLETIRSGAALGATAIQEETDPTVPDWAKAETKPSYTASEITDGESNVATEIKTQSEQIDSLNDEMGTDPASDDKWKEVAEQIEKSNDGYSALVDLCVELPQASMGDKIDDQIEIENTHLKNILKELEEGMRL